jgi:hypothetical protein
MIPPQELSETDGTFGLINIEKVSWSSYLNKDKKKVDFAENPNSERDLAAVDTKIIEILRHQFYPWLNKLIENSIVVKLNELVDDHWNLKAS